MNNSTKQTAEEKNRDVTYDWLRLIATIFVIIGHSAYLSIHTTMGGVSYSLPEYTNSFYYNSHVLSFLRYLSSWVYTFHMPLFFILSGCVLGLKPIGTFEKVTKSKIKRLLVPYFVCGWLFMLPVKLLGGFYNKETFLLAMNGFLSGTDSGHLWFLPALFWTFIVFIILEKICKRFKINNPYVLLMLAGVIQLLYNRIPFDVLGFKIGMSYIFWFALGFCFEHEKQKNIKWNLKKTTIAFLILLVIEYLNKRYSLLNSFFLILCGSFMTYLFADICSRLFKNVAKTKIWQIIVRNLFSIYLFHDPLEYIVLRVFMTSNYMSSVFGCISYTLLRTLGVFIVSIILGELVRIMKRLIMSIIENNNFTFSKAYKNKA